MQALPLHEFHQSLGARFSEVNGMEVVGDYGHVAEEHRALTTTAAFLDLSFRSRLCLTGNDRVRFLHGQVTNDIRGLGLGEGCYAALVTAKGRMQSDLNIYSLANELLLDFEPGLAQSVAGRLEKYIVADDVQVLDVAGHYGLLSIQGLAAPDVVRKLAWFSETPVKSYRFLSVVHPVLGELYLVNQPRLGLEGFDLFIPLSGLREAADSLLAATRAAQGCLCGWQASEAARIEAGIPRFGPDMDESNLPPECGIEQRAVSYTKGCYIGQEVLNRVHTMGHANRQLCRLALANDPKLNPQKGDKLFHRGREVGLLTSVAVSTPSPQRTALGYVRREVNQIGTDLKLATAAGETTAKIIRKIDLA